MKEKPILKLYEYKDSQFIQIAQIDDYQQVSFEHNLYKAGTFTITINYNIPNAKLFKKGLFIQFGNNKFDFGVIEKITNSIGSDGKGSELINIIGYDARYLFKRRIIKNLNSNDKWTMTDKAEMCIRSLVYSEAGVGAETARQLPIANAIPTSENAIGKKYSVSESYTNLYDVLCTIATQGEIGWAVTFKNNELSLEVYAGENKSSSVFFSTDYESLSKGEFTDSNESFANSIYIGGKGTGSERDLFEGSIDDGSGNEPSSLDRFEAFDNQSSMTTEEEYEAEANSMLTQYGQTITVSGAGMVKCPFVFREEYDIGDIIRMKFSDKTADVQILSVTEQWSWNTYSLSFSFGKPQNTLGDQLNLILKKIEIASNKTNAIESVKWYTIPTDTEQTKADVTYNTLGFTGVIGNSNRTFTLYFDEDSKTGSKSYTLYAKNLTGSGKLILTTGVTGSETVELSPGSYVANLYVNEDGDVVSTFMGIVNEVNTLSGEVETIEQAISSGAIPTFDIVYPVGCTYTQFPHCLSPNDLWGSISTWTELDFGGAFFRASGGNANAFSEKGSVLMLQSDMVKSHTHTYGGTTEYMKENSTHTHGQNAPSGTGKQASMVTWSGGAGTNGVAVNYEAKSNKMKIITDYTDINHRHDFNGTTSSNDSNAYENRPMNYTIRVWKRTA